MRAAAIARRARLALSYNRPLHARSGWQWRSLTSTDGEKSEAPRPSYDGKGMDNPGRELAKLAKISMVLREAIQENAKEGSALPEFLVSVEQETNEAFEIIERTLDKAGRPCTVEQLADRIDENQVEIPRHALGYKDLLRAALLRDSIEHILVGLDVLPPAETFIDGAGKPFSRLDRKALRQQKEQEERRASNPDEFVEAELPLKELRPVSEIELARRKAKMESATKMSNVLRGFDTALLELGRVHKVVRGGTTMSMRALVVIGNRKGTAGYGEGKSDTAQHAIERACREAKRNLLHLDLHEDRTIFHRVEGKYVKSRVVLWPAPKGVGISANNNFSAVFQLFGLKDIGAKLHGPRSLSNAIKGLFNALSNVHSTTEIVEARGLQELVRPPRRTESSGRLRKLRVL